MRNLLVFSASLPLSTAFLSQKDFFFRPATHLHLESITDENRLFRPHVYETIQSGKIAIIPNFLPISEIQALRTDAQNLHAAQKFSTDALSAYGASGKFDPSRDRAVLKLNQWKDTKLGDWSTRKAFGQRMAAVRADLARNLNRPHLDQGLATTKYGNGSTEISYTRFGPGAFLRRHVDEHHEELKGTAGWAQPTRRSVSWLIYLNEPDWDGPRDGGQLRCFERTCAPSQTVGARPNGDLQIGWLRSTPLDPVERPVFLDGRYDGHGKCAMYVVRDDNVSKEFITPQFDANPILYMAGSEVATKKLLIDRWDLAERFHFIEPPKSKLGDLLAGNGAYAGTGMPPADDEELAEVDPIGGTLVLFDSVSLPHEVLATKNRERWATSGWMHEDQQPIFGDRSV